MSKQQRDAIDAAMRAEPFDLSQSTAERGKAFEALMVRPYPADVTAADVTVGGVGAIELTVAGQAAEPAVRSFHGGGDAGGARPSRARRAPARVVWRRPRGLARPGGPSWPGAPAAGPCPWTTGSPLSTPTQPRWRTALPLMRGSRRPGAAPRGGGARGAR